jgi:hypothetical protein
MIEYETEGDLRAMSRPLRLEEELVAQAEVSAALNKRSIPKQIEFWAELGRRVERQIDHSDLLAVLRDLAIVEVRPLQPEHVDIDAVFERLATDRASGGLVKSVTRAGVVYEASISRPGLLDRIDSDGGRVTGTFLNGEFIANSGIPNSSA